MEQGGDSVRSGVKGSRLRRTLLIVEEDVWTRYSAAEYFRARGFRVLEAKSPDEAMSLLCAGKLVDAVFSDSKPPEPAGTLSLTDWIAQQYPTLPVLLTGASRESPRGVVAALSPRAFIVKPYLLAEVERQIVGLM